MGLGTLFTLSPVAVRRDDRVHGQGLGDGAEELPGCPLRDVMGVLRGVGVVELAPLQEYVHELFPEAPVHLCATSTFIVRKMFSSV